MTIFLDNSRISDYRNCPRYYYFRHVRHWATPKDGIALIAGSAWHKGMDAIWEDPEETHIVDFAAEVWADYMLENDYDVYNDTFALTEFRTKGCFKEMFKNYVELRKSFLCEIDLLGIEQPFVVPISETEKVFYVGILDKIFRYKDRVHICDHKTTSMYAKAGGFRPIWLNGFSPNSQIDGYQYSGLILYGDEFDDVWIDGALVHKTVHDKFIFLPQKRSQNMLEAWLSDTNLWVSRIIDDLAILERQPYEERSLSATVLPCFPKSAPNSCTSYGRECVYKDICLTILNPEKFQEPPDGFYVRPWNPVDEDKLQALVRADA